MAALLLLQPGADHGDRLFRRLLDHVARAPDQARRRPVPRARPSRRRRAGPRPAGGASAGRPAPLGSAACVSPAAGSPSGADGSRRAIIGRTTSMISMIATTSSAAISARRIRSYLVGVHQDAGASSAVSGAERHVLDLDHVAAGLVEADGRAHQAVDLLELARLERRVHQLALGVRRHPTVDQHRHRQALHPAADLGVVAQPARDLVVDRLLGARGVLVVGAPCRGRLGCSVGQVVADRDRIVVVALGDSGSPLRRSGCCAPPGPRDRRSPR